MLDRDASSPDLVPKLLCPALQETKAKALQEELGNPMTLGCITKQVGRVTILDDHMEPGCWNEICGAIVLVPRFLLGMRDFSQAPGS